MAAKGVSLSQSALDRLTLGAPALVLADLGAVAGLEPGRPLRLLDPHGEVVATGVADPENGVVHIFARQAVRGLDAGFFRERVEAALALRKALGLVDGVSAYRLINGEGDGLPGLWVEVFGRFAVLSAAASGLLPLARLLAEQVRAISGAAGVVLKVRGKDPQDRSLKDEVLGETPPQKMPAP